LAAQVDAANRRWTAREADRSDFVRISEFRRKFQLTENASQRRSIGPEYFEWKLLRNPVQRGDIFVVEDEGRIIAQLGVTPKWLKVGDRKSVV
jgi:hypothetical protein